jgi:hypothetical protein
MLAKKSSTDDGSLGPFGSVLDPDSGSPMDATLIGDLYVNRKFGLAFRKPPGWVFEDRSTPPPAVEVRSGLDTRTTVGPTVVWRLADDFPAVVSIAAPEGDAESDRFGSRAFRPTVTVHLEGQCSDEQAWAEGEFSLLRFVEEHLRGIAACRSRFRLDAGPGTTRVSRRHAVEYRASYARYAEGFVTPVRTRERALYVAQCPMIYAVRMVDYPSHNVRPGFDFDEFVTSISFA